MHIEVRSREGWIPDGKLRCCLQKKGTSPGKVENDTQARSFFFSSKNAEITCH